MVHALNSFVAALENIYKYLAVFFAACSVILGVGRVVVRNLPIPGSGFTGEFAIASFVWAVLLAIAWLVNSAEHLEISVFYEKMPPRTQRIFSLAFLLIIIFIGFLMFYEGIIYIYNTRSVVVTYFGHPRWITFYLPLPISGFGVIIFGIKRFLSSIRSGAND